MLITRPLAYNESLQHPTIAVLLLNSNLDFCQLLSSVRLFQSNQRFQVIESRGPTRIGKALNLIFPKRAQLPDHATIFSSGFHGVRKDRLAQ